MDIQPLWLEERRETPTENRNVQLKCASFRHPATLLCKKCLSLSASWLLVREVASPSGSFSRFGARLLVQSPVIRLIAAPQRSQLPGHSHVRVIGTGKTLQRSGWEMLYGDGRTVATCCTLPRKLYRSSLTSNVLLHSPARCHSNGHAQYRHFMPSQVWTRQDSNLRPYNTSST